MVGTYFSLNFLQFLVSIRPHAPDSSELDLSSCLHPFQGIFIQFFGSWSYKNLFFNELTNIHNDMFCETWWLPYTNIPKYSVFFRNILLFRNPWYIIWNGNPFEKILLTQSACILNLKLQLSNHINTVAIIYKLFFSEN